MNFKTSTSLTISLMIVNFALPAFGDNAPVIINPRDLCGGGCIIGDRNRNQTPIPTQQPVRSDRPQLRPTLDRSSASNTTKSAVNRRANSSPQKTGCQSNSR
jgi:hypothetical protein